MYILFYLLFTVKLYLYFLYINFKNNQTRLQQKKDTHTQQQQQKKLEDEFDQILKDNEAHFKREQPKPTAVLPIVAPKRIWDRYDMYHIPQQMSTTLTSSTRPSSILGEAEVPTSSSTATTATNKTNKRKLSSYLEPKYDMSEATREMYEEALAYDQNLELRSEQARLQDPTFVQNCATDPMLVAEYEEEIFEHLRKQEVIIIIFTLFCTIHITHQYILIYIHTCILYSLKH